MTKLTNIVMTKLLAAFDKADVAITSIVIETLFPLVFTFTAKDQDPMTCRWELPTDKGVEFLGDGRRNWRWFKANMTTVLFDLEREQLATHELDVEFFDFDPEDAWWIEEVVEMSDRLVIHFPHLEPQLTKIRNWLVDLQIEEGLPTASADQLADLLAEPEVDYDAEFDQFLAQLEAERSEAYRQSRLIPGTDCLLPDGMDLATYTKLQAEGFAADWHGPDDKYAVSPAKLKAHVEKVKAAKEEAPF